MGVIDTTEADWEEYYRNVNAFNIPNADAKRVEIWDKAFLSTKTVRETLWEVYSKGFMDGVNDTAERYKNSAYKQKYDSELFDRCSMTFKSIIRNRHGQISSETEKKLFEDIDAFIAELKAEVSENANES